MVKINTRRHAMLAQEAYDNLPISEQVVLKRGDEIQARLINDMIRKRSQEILGSIPNVKPLHITWSTELHITEKLAYFEVWEILVDKENLGKPTLPRGEIEINPKQASITKPQAWSKRSDKKLQWHYNYEGAKKEAKHRGWRLPTIVELVHILNFTTMTARGVASLLHIPFAWCRSATDGSYSDEGKCAFLWSSSTEDLYHARDAYLCRHQDTAGIGYCTRALGFSVRIVYNAKK